MRFRGISCVLLGFLFINLSLLFASYIPLQDKTISATKKSKQGGINTSQSKVFDGLYANYTFEFLGATNNSVFRYTQVSGEYYNVSWTIQGSGSHSWIESIKTRVTSNSSGIFSYCNNRHTPIWQFTNISLGNVTLIAVNGMYNHVFKVSGETDHNYPGIGYVEIWILKDMNHRLGIAWYEKRTGLLLNGTFAWSRGSYTLTLISTNIFSYYQVNAKVIPWYNYLVIIMFVSIITLLIVKKVRQASL